VPTLSYRLQIYLLTKERKKKPVWWSLHYSWGRKRLISPNTQVINSTVDSKVKVPEFLYLQTLRTEIFRQLKSEG
jgi:hypothetical protein